MDGKSPQDRVPLLLQKAAAALCTLLDLTLPSVSDRWWDALVLPNLSFQQQRAVDAKGITKRRGWTWQRFFACWIQTGMNCPGSSG